MKTKPLNPKLPGRHAAMTRAQLDTLVAKLDRPIPLKKTRPLTAKERIQRNRAKRRGGG